MNLFVENQRFNKGYFLVFMLVFASIAIVAIIALVSFVNTNLVAGKRALIREQAFQLAEAGIEYYRWHLAHDQDDFTDGGGAFPHSHEFYDKDGELVGTYELTITPPPTGSTLVRMESTGIPLEDPSIRRTIVSELAIPSFARFALVTDSDMRFGEGTIVYGPVHSNRGIRFDGLAYNLVTSALTSYNDPDHTGNNEFAVHTHVNSPPSTTVNESFRPQEAPPTSPIPSRTDVFLAGRRFPVPTNSFSTISTDLTSLRTLAQNGGQYFAASGSNGYRVTFRTDDTYDVHRVTSIQSVPSGCSSSGQTGWGSWSVGNTTFVGNYPNPGNGILFFEDHVWVEGQIDTARITLAAGRLPEGSDQKSITFNNDLLYSNYDGSDVIALIAQNNINAGLYSQDNLRVDAALISKNGRIGRYYYENDCSPYDERDTLTLYGMVGSFLRYGFAYTNGSGYETRNLIYDGSLLYAPPPSFPLTSDTYQIISWQEITND